MAANAPLIDELVQIEDLRWSPSSTPTACLGACPGCPPSRSRAACSIPPADEPPADVPMLAARATLMARESLHPDLARLVVKSLSAVMPLALVGDPAAFPSLERSEFTANEDARKFFLEGPTPLESFLPFEIASPLSRIYLVLLPLLVLAFPIWTLTKAGIAWYMRGRINNWYPRIHDAERRIDTAPLAQLREDDEALRALAEQLSTKTRVPAGVRRRLLRSACRPRPGAAASGSPHRRAGGPGGRRVGPRGRRREGRREPAHGRSRGTLTTFLASPRDGRRGGW